MWLACKCQGFELPVTVDEYGHRSDCEGCAGPNCGPPAPERTECGYSEHGFKPFQGPKDEPGKPHCLTCGHAWGECSGHWAEDDPPLTPEEEEEAAPCLHESWEVTSQWRDDLTNKWWKSRRCADCGEVLDSVPEDEQHDFDGSLEELALKEREMEAMASAIYPEEEPSPPQPERRPPYAVAYSVNGHLYELALPGDATVVALDGTLIIEHSLGPVAGIVQVLPVKSKEVS